MNAPVRDATVTRKAAIALLYAAIAAAFCLPLFERPFALGVVDWDEKLFHYGSVLKSVIEYGQMPFWNPWQCGGGVLWENPLVPLLDPVYPLTMIFGIALATKVAIVLHYAIGLIGMHLLLTEVLGVEFLPLVVYLSSLFVLSGSMAIHLAVGHSVMLPAFYLPWLLYFFMRAVETGRLRESLFGGMTFALMIYNAGLHILAMTVLATAVFGVTIAITRRSWKPVVLAAAVGVSGLLYAAPKLIPMLLFVGSDRFWDTREATVHPDRMNVAMMLRQYLDPYQGGRLVTDDLQRWRWFEYANYIGALAPLLIVACVIWLVWKHRTRSAWLGWSFAVTAAFLLTWSAGEFAWFAPASIAQHVPLLSKFRVPSRFTIGFVLFAAGTIAWTWRTLAPAVPRPAATFVALVCVLATVQLAYQNRGYFSGTFAIAPLDRGFRAMGGPRVLVTDAAANPYTPNAPMLRSLMNDRAFYNCYESFQLVHTALPDGPLVSTTGDARISDTSFTPNRVDFSVVGGREPATIVLNQNYAEGWRSTAGPVVLDAKTGRMAVILPPGTTGSYAFSFVPPGLWAGLVLLAGAAVASRLLWTARLG